MKKQQQRGGFAIGLVVGVLIGLALALVVAIYVTKVPVPFVDKVPQRNQGQEAADAEKNRNWDPNAPLLAKPQARPGEAASAATTPAPVPTPATISATTATTPPAAAAAASAITPVDGSQFVVQVGAYTRSEDAEAQRAKLAINGLEARVSEREQSGKAVFRVRLGPFESRDKAEAVREQATAAGYVEATVMRAQPR
ncbi:MAG: hypothetical protein RL722_1805 [Pseudomonadota bacterium]|jgi:cell division protein FtsN